jgi:O-antigen ligase
MTPWNYELFEFNKMLLVYFFTILIVAAWLIKMITDKKFLFKRSFWDIPLVLFFLSQLVSFLVSIDRHTSLWGYYSRFNGGLVSIFCYLLLYWAFVNNMDKRKTLYSMFYVLCSATLVAFYGVAEHFGIDAQAWVQDVRNRVFSTLGQPNWLAAWLVALIPLTWGLVLNSKHEARNPKQYQNSNDKNSKRLEHLNFKHWNLFRISNLEFRISYIYYFLFAIYYLCLLYTKSRSGLLGFAATFIIFWPGAFLLYRRHLKAILKPFLIFAFSFLVLSFTVGTPWTPTLGRLVQKPSVPPKVEEPSAIPIGGTESGEIRKIVWKGALEVWKHNPVFGTGVETFAYSYYWQRPREHNDLSEWDFLYNKAHNEYLNYAANTGTIGLLAYLGVIGTFIVWSLRQLKIGEAKFNLAFLAGLVSILVTNFFGFSVVAVNLLFFLFPAMSFVLVQKQQTTDKKQQRKEFKSLSWIQIVFISLFVLCSMFYVLRLTQYWYADARFALSEKLSKGGQTNQAFTELQKAVQIRPEPIYRDELGITAAELAVAAFQQKQATLSAQLTKFAIKESDNALKISPYNVNFWKNRTRLFYALAEIDPKYNQEALKSLLKAYTLAPTDAKIAYNLGVLYSKLGQEETALQILEKTVALKPNYDQARYALGLFYEKQGKIDKAREQFQYIIEKINPNYEPAVEKLKTLK